MAKENKPKYVYMLWHIYKISKIDDNELFIGVFEKKIDTKKAIQKLKSKAGFRNHQRAFKIFKHELGRIGWTDGFFTYRY